MLTYSLATLAGFVLLMWGADRFVVGAAGTARNLGVPPLLIGLTLVGFGTFSKVRRKARKGRNPQTGEAIKIKAKNVVKFKPGKKLQDAV